MPAASDAVIRRALPSDRSAVAETVAAAFADDPAWAFILGEDYARLAVDFAGALFDTRVARQHVWVADDLATVAMWDPPGGSVGPPGYIETIWSRYNALAGNDAMRRLSSYNDAVAAAASPEDHWYLGVLATRPERQREGLASAALSPVLTEADRLGLACCLETSTESNRLFYEGRGFSVTAAIELPGGPLSWWLRRSPARR
jgi:GNAT superfamily N-acetyltransferase